MGQKKDADGVRHVIVLPPRLPYCSPRRRGSARASYFFNMAKIPTVSGGVFHGDNLDCPDSFFELLIDALAIIYFNPDVKRPFTH